MLDSPRMYIMVYECLKVKELGMTDLVNNVGLAQNERMVYRYEYV